MGPGLAAMLVFILLILIWSVFVKRNIGEVAFIGMIVVALFGGDKAGGLLLGGIKYALSYEVLFASLAFVFMSFLLQSTGVLQGMLKIFNRLFRKMKGGPAYVNTAISAFLGMLSGGNTPNAATSGAFTSQWLLSTGWKREQAATLIAANGGLGAGFPPSSSLFIVLAFPTVAGAVSEGQLYIALFLTGIYQVIWRVFYIHCIIKKNHIVLPENVTHESWGTIMKTAGKNLFLFVGAILPVALNMGPLSDFIAGRSEIWAAAVDSINILVWIPIMMIVIILLLGWKDIKANFKSKEQFVEDLIPHFSSTGGLLIFVFAASNIISKLGLSDDIVAILNSMSLSKIATVIIILILVAVVAGPLSSTATLTSIGVISHAILVSVGVDPLLAATGILVVASTEGASPPASGALFVACGLTECDPPKIFMPLITWFVLPITGIAALVCLGILPVPH